MATEQDQDVEDGTEDIDPADLDDLGDLGDDDEAEDGQEGSPAAWKPPTKGEWDRLQRRIKRLTDKGTKTGRKPAADVDRQLAAQLRGGKAKDEEDEAGDSAEAERWRGIAIQNAASAQISAAGFTGTAQQAAKLARLIDTEGITPDRHGRFDLEDEIEELKEDYPQLFSTAGDGRRRAPAVRRADTRQAAPTKDPTRATSDALMKAAGYR